MKFDIIVSPSHHMTTDAQAVQQAEAMGFDGVWASEDAHNPFFPLTLGAKATHTIRIGTLDAVAFPRSPMVTAQIAWDLAKQSDGRFILGLDMLSPEHVTQRFGESWSDPINRMREYIEGMRAIWDTFQNDARLRYRGEHYQFRLMAPFFNPGKINTPDIPVYITSHNAESSQLAGEICDGLHVQRVHSARYLQEVIMPAVQSGLDIAQKSQTDFSVTVPVWVITGTTSDEQQQAQHSVKSKIATYASNASSQAVMTYHGWSTQHETLQQMARDKQWDMMAQVITDDMLHEIAIIAEPDDVIATIRQRYQGLADRICLMGLPENTELQQTIAKQIQA
jgi:probable F420-dependent oxidoreductase